MGSGGMAAKSAGLTKSQSNTDTVNSIWKQFQSMGDRQLGNFLVQKNNVDVSTLNRWSDTQKTVTHLGMNDKPIVLDNASWDASASKNALDGVYLWRGVTGNSSLNMTARDVIDQLKFGDKTFIGDGIHGDGIYLTTKFGYAQSYSDGSDGSIAKAYIDKSKAKVITEGALRTMHSNESGSAAYLDLSSYALYKGYNVIHVPGGNSAGKYGAVNNQYSYKKGGQDFYNVLDRSVLVIRDTSR